MTRIALVLGAGGVVGQAYHAGALAALEHDLGWDPREADVIVGSSAGSVTGALLRAGVAASDLASAAVESPLSAEAAPLFERLTAGAPVDLGEPSPLDSLRPWRGPTRSLLARTVARPWAFRPGAVLCTLLPDGRIDIAKHTGALQELCHDTWPDGLWINAVRRRDAARVVFGRAGAPEAPLGLAVAASCAIPGYFAPVRIGGVAYLDGGVHSPTNADVLRNEPEPFDLVVVLSSMSVAGGYSTGADAFMRWSAHQQLQIEIARLRASGTTVVSFEPGRKMLPVMGPNAMATDRTDAVVQAAFLATGARAARPEVAARLLPLTRRRARLQLLAS